MIRRLHDRAKQLWREDRARFLARLFALVAFAGFADATFLAIEHFFGAVPPCTVVAGCEAVTRSAYATLGGVPVAVLGSAYYFAMLIAALLFLNQGEAVLMRAAAWLTIVGMVASLYFVSLQLFVIDAICLYCMVSAVTSGALFVLSFPLRRYLPRD